MNVRTKFEVRAGFTSSWDNRGYWKNGQSLDTPTLPFLQFFWWAFVRMDPVNIPAKFEVRGKFELPEIIGGTQKIGQSLDTPTLPFLQNFSWACVRMDTANVSAKFAVCSFSRSWDISDCGFEVGLRSPYLGEGEALGGRGWYRSKKRLWLPIGSP